jgi:hypothetical protein
MASDLTNNIGFRDDVERSIVVDVAGRLRFSGVLYGGDPAGVTFHNSAQRALWLAGQRDRVDKDEAETFRKIRQADHEACLRTDRVIANSIPWFTSVISVLWTEEPGVVRIGERIRFRCG